MNITKTYNAFKALLVGKRAEVTFSTTQKAKDNTPVNRRLNRMIRIKRSLETLENETKRAQLQSELDEHLKELNANSAALVFLQELEQNK